MNNFIAGFFTTLAILALICILLGGPLMLLWNWTIPYIFEGIPKISFWQAIGLNLICAILFKSPTTTSKKD